MKLSLPVGDGDLVTWRPSGTPPVAPEPGGFTSRVAYAATHVVPDPLREQHPGRPPIIDWDTTISIRQHLWALGLGVAEAMDTAQRGSGVAWDTARELIRRTASAAEGPAVYGAATDHLAPGGVFSLDEITDAYQEQVAYIEGQGGQAIVMASRHLASMAQSAEDYTSVYHDVISSASHPVMIHWLGTAFDPSLQGYWGSDDPWAAAETVLQLAKSHPHQVTGVKLSVLDTGLEIDLRRRLPEGVALFTGDDLDYVELIRGDDTGHSDALLGVLGPIAPAACVAFQALDRNDDEGYRSALEPTVPLARHMFSEPTFDYKTGIAFLAYLNGLQGHFRMVAGAESARSLPHLARILVLADEAGLLVDPELAIERMRPVLEVGGIHS
ncbi:MAG TPA: dihydrodipicolinate synthase family protein [Acidimicrobiia bacterium]|nr:dihydrodipicolinate synthase family protein [Acidimicrobiia bacterium]